MHYTFNDVLAAPARIALIVLFPVYLASASSSGYIRHTAKHKRQRNFSIKRINQRGLEKQNLMLLLQIRETMRHGVRVHVEGKSTAAAPRGHKTLADALSLSSAHI